MKRILVFAYGTASYLVFLATFLYAMGFVGNFVVPRTLDGPATLPLLDALLVNLGLLSLFAVQHSLMARPFFKRWLTRFVPESMERSTYVLASSLALILLFYAWQPLGGSVWEISSSAGRNLMYAGFAFGWSLVLVSTFAINHFDLFGLRQVWRNLLGRPQQGLKFTTPWLYRIVRHPLYVGWFFAFWCTPMMTLTHLLFALVTTAYILVAIRFEERDLRRAHPEYAAYSREVPMLIPKLPRGGSRKQALRRSGEGRNPVSLPNN